MLARPSEELVEYEEGCIIAARQAYQGVEEKLECGYDSYGKHDDLASHTPDSLTAASLGHRVVLKAAGNKPNLKALLSVIWQRIRSRQ